MPSPHRIVLSATLFSLLVSCGGDGGTTGPVTGTIRGSVTADGQGLQATVSLSGPETRTTTTTGSGDYAFSDLSSGTYTVSISELPEGAVFEVTSRTASLGSGQEEATVDFQGGFIRGTISGTVTTDVGPVEDVTVRAVGPESVEAATDADGAFRLEARPGGYTVSPVDVDPFHYEFPEPGTEVSVAAEETTSVAFEGTDLWGPCALGRLDDSARVSGALEDGDCTSADGFQDVYVYYGAVGETLEIELISTDFDAFLLLRGPAGDEVTTDADEGEETAARVSHTFQAPGRYWVEVGTGASGGAGSYALALDGQGGGGPGVWKSVATGWYHSCGTSSDGSGQCWGRNHFGQVGDGESGAGLHRTRPTRVSGEIVFREISAGAGSSCGVDYAYAAHCWGSNRRGELGIGTSGTDDVRSTPQAVTGGLTFDEVSVGADHACGLTTDGEAYCWGDGTDGQLGTGSGQSSSPQLVSHGTGFVVVTAGWFYTCAIDADGVGLCWGANGRGELGIDASGDRPTPTPIAGELRFEHLDAGFAHTCGVTDGGRGFCWGDNGSGQLGIGTSSADELRRAPERVAGNLTLESISVGGFHTCALDSSGKAWCWGSDAQGQLGRGGLGDAVDEPVRVGGNLTFRSIHAGLGHTCGVTIVGDAYCWGANFGDSTGALGIGTTGHQSTPQRVLDPEEPSGG